MRKFTIALFIAALGIITSANAQNTITVTLAGNGTAGFSNDGLSTLGAMVNMPLDVCTDAAGNIYFSDSLNGRIRKISATNGLITTYAGGGTSSAEGIPAVNALLTPRNICIDGAGNLYVVYFNRIRKIDAVTKLITTVAGTGTAGYSGDGGPAISATFNGIFGIAADATGNIYLVDQMNHRVRKIDAATGIVNTIAGTGTPGTTGDGGLAIAATLNKPTVICVMPTGEILFGDNGGGLYQSTIRRIDPVTGIITRVAGAPSGDIFGVLSINTWLGELTGLCPGHSGDFYCNEISCSCRRCDHHTDSCYRVAGDFGIESFSDFLFGPLSNMNNPYGLCTDASENIYIADKLNQRIRKVIQVTATPSFAYGKGMFIFPCVGSAVSVDSTLMITDLDMGQTETWTIVTPPTHGTLSGFPATAPSNGLTSVVAPAGTSYTLTSAYSGLDSFKVMVSDGTLSSTFMVYVGAGAGDITGPAGVCAGSAIHITGDMAGGVWSMSNTNASIDAQGVVTGVAGGTDNVIYTLTNACGTSTVTKAITIDAAVPASAGTISGLTSVCAGSTISLSNITVGGLWTVTGTGATISTSGVVSGITAGSVTVVYTISNSCGGTSTSQDITINPLPDAGSISGGTSVCKGSVITLTDGTTGGVWSTNNGHATISGVGMVTGMTPGTVTVAYAVTNVCGTATATQDIVVTICTSAGVPVASVAPAVTVFPNPASSVLNIGWEALQSGNATISLTDVTGRVVLTNEVNSNGTGNTALNVSGLNEGVYLLAVTSGSYHFTQKVSIAK